MKSGWLVALGALLMASVVVLTGAVRRPPAELSAWHVLNGSPTGGEENLSVPDDDSTVYTSEYDGLSAVYVVNDGSAKTYCTPLSVADGGVDETNGTPFIANAEKYWLLTSGKPFIGCGGSSATTTVRIRKLE